MTSRSRTAVVLAVLAGALVLVRVVGSSVRTLVTAPGAGLLTVATALLLVAALAFLAAVTWFVAGEARPAARRVLGVCLTGYVAVMAGYLVLGRVLGLHVPWTAYAVLVGVTVLGTAAVVVDRRRA